MKYHHQSATSNRSVTVSQVYLNAAGSLKLGCLAQAMMVAPKDAATTPGNGVGGMDGHVDGEIDMEIEVGTFPEPRSLHVPTMARCCLHKSPPISFAFLT